MVRKRVFSRRKRKGRRLLKLLIFVLVLGVVLSQVRIPSETIKNKVIAAVAEKTGRRLAISGDFGLEIVPSLRVVANDVTFANPPWATHKNMAEIGKLDISVEMWPLLEGDVVVKTITLNDVTLNLERKSTGQTSWTFPASQEKKEGTAAQKTVSLVANAININRGKLVYLDHSKSKTMQANIHALKSSLQLKEGITVIGGRLEVTKFLTVDRQKARPKPLRLFSMSIMDFSPLKNIDMDLDLRVKELVAGKQVIKNIRTTIRIKNKIAALQNLKAQWAGGSIAGGVALDTQKSPANLSVKARLTEAYLSDITRTVGVDAGLEANQGPLEALVDLTSFGNAEAAFAKNLKGVVKFKTGQGRLGKDVLSFISSDLFAAMVPNLGQKVEREKNMLNCFNGRFDINRGYAGVTTLVLDTRRLTVLGSGSVNLGGERFDLQLTPYVKQNTVIDLALPIEIKGPLMKPRIGPGGKDVAKGAVGAIVGVPQAPLRGLLGAIGKVAKIRELEQINDPEDQEIIEQDHCALSLEKVGL